MKALCKALLLLLACCDLGNCQSLVVDVIKSEHNEATGRLRAEFKVDVPNETIAVVSKIPILWVDRKIDKVIQEVDGKTIMFLPGSYRVTIVLSEVNPLIAESRFRLSITVVAKDVLSTLYSDTRLPIDGIKYGGVDAGSGTFDVQIAGKKFPVFQIKVFPNPAILIDSERGANKSRHR